MRNILLFVAIGLIFTACGGKGNKKVSDKKAGIRMDTSIVYVFYFHGKQRCETCLEVEKITKQIINTDYAGNDKVKYVEINVSEKEGYEKLIEQYQITWNGLIIAKGNDSVNITEQAFADAIHQPQKLVDLIKSEVNKRIESGNVCTTRF